MLIRNYLRFLTLSILAITAIFSLSIAASAQAGCNNFVNPCNVPSSWNTFNISDSLIGMTGEVGEPTPNTFIDPADNPLETVWYHWAPNVSGFVTADMAGTNPAAIGPSFISPYVVDTTLAVYTGSTLTTLTRVRESNNWVSGDTNCTLASRPAGESILSSCIKFFAVAGTSYHFQIDKFNEPNPLNNNTFFRVRLVAPTAASVSIGGRVTNDSGRGISRSIVTLTDANGNERTATTNPFGYYRFTDVESGQNYTMVANRKGYQFENNPRVINVSENIEGENFVGSNPFSKRE
jgi:hypothetical protein